MWLCRAKFEAGFLVIAGVATISSGAAIANEALFKANCGECHRSAGSVARGFDGEAAAATSAALLTFLERHHAPDPIVRKAIVDYLSGLLKQ